MKWNRVLADWNKHNNYLRDSVKQIVRLTQTSKSSILEKLENENMDIKLKIYNNSFIRMWHIWSLVKSTWQPVYGEKTIISFDRPIDYQLGSSYNWK